jgi:AcrR family transcriptional regulator
MAARAGIRRDDVIAEAILMIDEGTRPADLSLGALARRLGIRPQSLYAHVNGTEGLGRAVAVAGLGALAAAVTAAGIGVSGTDAVAAIVRAHLDFASRRPGLYEAAIRPPGDDPELLAAVEAVSAPLEQVLTGMGMGGDDRVHWTRLFLSSVYGYAALGNAGRFALPVSTDDTEAALIEMLTRRLVVSA